jgi:hypothetical protein
LVAKASAKHEAQMARLTARLEIEKAKNAVIDPKEPPVAKLINPIKEASEKNSYYSLELLETLASRSCTSASSTAEARQVPRR